MTLRQKKKKIHVNEFQWNAFTNDVWISRISYYKIVLPSLHISGAIPWLHRRYQVLLKYAILKSIRDKHVNALLSCIGSFSVVLPVIVAAKQYHILWKLLPHQQNKTMMANKKIHERSVGFHHFFDYGVQFVAGVCFFLFVVTGEKNVTMGFHQCWITIQINLSNRKENPASQQCSAMHIKKHAQVFDITLKFSTSHRWFQTHVLFNLERKKKLKRLHSLLFNFIFYVLILTQSSTLSYVSEFYRQAFFPIYVSHALNWASAKKNLIRLIHVCFYFAKFPLARQ